MKPLLCLDGFKNLHMACDFNEYLSICMQLLQTVAVDVTTRGSLGKCLAVRVGDVLNNLKSVGVETTLACADVETDLLKHSRCRKSQQKFLHTKSTDIAIKRGVGGNTQNQRCIILQQEMVDEEILLPIRQGM